MRRVLSGVVVATFRGPDVPRCSVCRTTRRGIHGRTVPSSVIFGVDMACVRGSAALKVNTAKINSSVKVKERVRIQRLTDRGFADPDTRE